MFTIICPRRVFISSDKKGEKKNRQTGGFQSCRLLASISTCTIPYLGFYLLFVWMVKRWHNTISSEKRSQRAHTPSLSFASGGEGHKKQNTGGENVRTRCVPFFPTNTCYNTVARFCLRKTLPRVSEISWRTDTQNEATCTYRHLDKRVLQSE